MTWTVRACAGGFVAMLFVGGSVSAQTSTSTSRLIWDQPNVADAAEAQGFIYRYYPDGATAGVVLSGVTCASSPVVCEAPFPAFTPGPHSLVLTASNAAGESPLSASLSFTFVVVPSAPQNPRIG